MGEKTEGTREKGQGARNKEQGKYCPPPRWA
jgi:hypothetical protein